MAVWILLVIKLFYRVFPSWAFRVGREMDAAARPISCDSSWVWFGKFVAHEAAYYEVAPMCLEASVLGKDEVSCRETRRGDIRRSRVSARFACSVRCGAARVGVGGDGRGARGKPVGGLGFLCGRARPVVSVIVAFLREHRRSSRRRWPAMGCRVDLHRAVRTRVCDRPIELL